MRRVSRAALLVVTPLFLFAASCSGSEDPGLVGPSSRPAPDPLRQIARQEGSVSVLVDLAVPPNADGTWARPKIAAAQRRLIKALGNHATVTVRYETTPQLGLDVELEGLAPLRASPLVLGINLDQSD